MSVDMMSLVFKCNMPELKTDKGQVVPDSTAKFVLLALADHANDEGEGAYPGIDLLCRKTNLSSATVTHALNALRTNGFTVLMGKSKRSTYNYTILVAKIREFQWLIPPDISGYNPAVLAAKTNPSVTISKPSLTASDIAEVNSFTDAILDNARKAKYPHREKFPEVLTGYADIYVELTGQEPRKPVITDWLETFHEWQGMNLRAGDLRAAHEKLTSSGIVVTRPGSLTKTAYALKSQGRAAKEPPQQKTELEQFLENEERRKHGNR